VAIARVDRVLLFLLPGGRRRRRADEGAAAATATTFFPLPFGRPGLRFPGTPSPSTTRAAPVEAAAMGAAAATSVEAAAVAAAGATPAESAVATTARAAEVFLLQLSSGWPRLRDTGSIAAGPSTFFPLPFMRPGFRLSGIPSPPMLGPPMADMVRLRSGKGSEAEEEVKCAFDPEHPWHLKRSEVGERADIMGSAMPNASVTAPLFSCHVHPREDNCRSHHDGSWVEPTGRATDARHMMFQEIITETIKSPSDGTLHCGTQASGSVGPISKGFKFRGAGRRLAAVKQPRAGSVLEPVRPETAGKVLQDLATRTTTSEPDERSWDFDGSEIALARNSTRRSPMLTHETSPVSGATVVGMTI
jgi:hypothetical protein